MRLLIIGGSVFLGKALVSVAQSRRHEITLFNRGVSSPVAEAGVTLITGDRNGDLTGLRGQTWDAVIDTCGYFPRQLDLLLAALAGRLGHYTFVSTVSAYADLGRQGLTESGELGKLEDATAETVTPQTYGPLKALCEAAAQQGMPQAHLIIRPGVIVGPNDPTDRLAHWLARITSEDEMLAVGRPEARVQMIDVRDLAAWMIAMVEAKRTGIFNAVGPREPMTMQQFLTIGRETLNPRARWVWADDAFLTAHGVTEWMKLPFYVPATAPQFGGLFAINGTKAFSNGLALRPLAETMGDTWQWMRGRAAGTTVKTGLSRAEELELIKARAHE